METQVQNQQALVRPGSLPPARSHDERGPGLRRPGQLGRLSPAMFRRLIERSSPVVEPEDPRTGSPVTWDRSDREYLPDGIEVPPRSVLIVRTDEVGDLALTLPLLTALRAAWPKAQITLVTRGSRGDMMRGGSLVDVVVPWPDDGSEGRRDSLSSQFRCWRFARRLLRQVRPLRGRFDLAVLPRRDAEHFGARYVACTAALRVVGFDPSGRPGRPGEVDERELLTDLVGAGDPVIHALRHGERLATAMGITITPDAYDAPGLALIGPHDRESAAGLLSPLTVPVGVSSGPVIALGLGTPLARGTWSPAAYAATIGKVHARLPVRVVLLGTAADRPLADEFVRALAPSVPLVSAVGRAPLRTTLALLAASDLYLGGIGDAMHLASAVATPCVTVTAQPTGGDPAVDDATGRAGPWSAGSRVIAPPARGDGCEDACVSDEPHCILGIGPDQVVQAVTDVLTGAGSSTPAPGAGVPRQPVRSAVRA